MLFEPFGRPYGLIPEGIGWWSQLSKLHLFSIFSILVDGTGDRWKAKLSIRHRFWRTRHASGVFRKSRVCFLSRLGGPTGWYPKGSDGDHNCQNCIFFRFFQFWWMELEFDGKRNWGSHTAFEEPDMPLGCIGRCACGYWGFFPAQWAVIRRNLWW